MLVAILVLIAYKNSERLNETVQTNSLAKTFAARTYNVGTEMKDHVIEAPMCSCACTINL